MTKLYRSLSVFLFFLAIASCSDDDPLPVPMVDFFLDPAVAEVGIPVMFDNLTTNADRYEWDFGDGQVFEDISPTVTFASPGDVTVTLRAYTQDNQVDSLSRTFRVYQRVLTSYILNVFPGFNGAEPWDPDEAGDEIWPDVAIAFTPSDANQSDPDNGFLDGQFVNVPDFARPIFNDMDNVALTYANPIIMGDENWTFLLLDVDTDNIETMMGVEFNPVQAPTVKSEDGLSGVMSIFIQDNSGAVLDFDLTFDLE